MPPVFQSIEHALDDVARFVEVCVVFELHFAVFARWDAGSCFGLRQPVAQVIGIVSSVRDDGATLGNIRFKTLTCLRNICAVPGCQPQMNWVTAAITNQM